ncbi:hypothetical protein [Bradyrhizobium sp. SZCCHNS1012]|uniref:hypothetical protein n=1 Tax=Bradyrhizobium sp. SZCCHNS1012 TaxID=3057297 RepID=UPI002916C06E|nr:hypothetical protein [Bradyrhizobium sp. SZCCHNS1012]
MSDYTPFLSSQMKVLGGAAWDRLIRQIAADLAALFEKEDVQTQLANSLLARGLQVIEDLVSPVALDAQTRVSAIDALINAGTEAVNGFTRTSQDQLDEISGYLSTIEHGGITANLVVETAARVFVDAVLKAKLAAMFASDVPIAPTPGANAPDEQIANMAAVRAALSSLLVSPTFTGAPKAPTPETVTSDDTIATTAFVHANVDDVKSKAFNKAGDTMTGNLNFDAPAGTPILVTSGHGGTNGWGFALDDGAGNWGLTHAGATVLKLTAAGALSLTGSLSVSGAGTFGSAQVNGDARLTRPNTNTGYVFFGTGSNYIGFDGSNMVSPNWLISPNGQRYAAYNELGATQARYVFVGDIDTARSGSAESASACVTTCWSGVSTWTGENSVHYRLRALQYYIPSVGWVGFAWS